MGSSRLNQQQQLAANAAAMAALQMAGANGHMGPGLHGGPGGRGHGLGRGGPLPGLSPPLPGSPEYQAAYQAAYQMALQQQQMQLMMSGMNPMGQVRRLAHFLKCPWISVIITVESEFWVLVSYIQSANLHLPYHTIITLTPTLCRRSLARDPAA